MRRGLLFVFFAILFGQWTKNKTPLYQIISEQFPQYERRAERLEIQVLYTRIDRDANNQPTFDTYRFRDDSAKYFYPASTIKLPLVLLALEKMNQLRTSGVDKFTSVYFDSVYSGQRSVRADPTSESGLPSIAHFCKKILMVSDNESANCLYEFLGQKAANEALRNKGYNARILQRLERGGTPDQNRHTEAVRFVRDGMTLYSQPMLINPDSIRAPRVVLKGNGYWQAGKLVRKPFDFTYKNSLSLQDQQKMLMAIVFPQSVPEKNRFDLSEEDRRFILQYMSQLPRESTYPDYRSDPSLVDATCKLLMFGGTKSRIPDNIRIFNKVGGAYGYLIDNAYIIDFENGVEFFLSAVINTNTDGIYNDDKYEYERLGYPFLRDLGQAIYKYELSRTRKHKPDLSEFKFVYDRP